MKCQLRCEKSSVLRKAEARGGKTRAALKIDQGNEVREVAGEMRARARSGG